MRSSSDIRTKNLVMAAVFAALICVATFVIKIPSPLNGYINLGDCFVLLAAWMLSPKLGFASAAIGSAAADLVAGYAVFAPATFVIKGLMALTAHYCFKALNKKTKISLSLIVSGVLAECVMILGYFIYEAFLYGAAASATGIPFNAIQGAVGIAAAYALYILVGRRVSETM